MSTAPANAPAPTVSATATSGSQQPACPVCGGATARYADKHAHGQLWHIERCRACGHGFVSNRPSLETLEQIYATTSSHLEWNPATVSAPAHERRSDARTLIAGLVAQTRERGPSLDVGCGDGAFSFHLAKHSFRPDMIDFDPRSADAAKVVPNSTFRRCSFESFTDDAAHHDPPRRFSAIVMSQVLEHALDPIDWLRRAADALSDDGVLAVAVPNFGGVYRLRAARDPFLIPPVHLNFFTPRSMRLAFERAGLSIRRMNSWSRVDLARRPGLGGVVRRVLQAAWNATSVALDPTARGVILRAYGKRARPGH